MGIYSRMSPLYFKTNTFISIQALIFKQSLKRIQVGSILAPTFSFTIKAFKKVSKYELIIFSKDLVMVMLDHNHSNLLSTWIEIDFHLLGRNI